MKVIQGDIRCARETVQPIVRLPRLREQEQEEEEENVAECFETQTKAKTGPRAGRREHRTRLSRVKVCMHVM